MGGGWVLELGVLVLVPTECLVREDQVHEFSSAKDEHQIRETGRQTDPP